MFSLFRKETKPTYQELVNLHVMDKIFMLISARIALENLREAKLREAIVDLELCLDTCISMALPDVEKCDPATRQQLKLELKWPCLDLADRGCVASRCP